MVSNHNIARVCHIIFTSMKYKKIEKHCFKIMENAISGNHFSKECTDDEIDEKNWFGKLVGIKKNMMKKVSRKKQMHNYV